jgi:Protein of unknown function (DUF1579)
MSAIRFLVHSLTLALLLGSGTGLAQDAKAKAPTPEQKAMMEACLKAGAPGPNHQLLAALKGRWSVTTQMWMEPGAPPEVSKGKAVNKLLLDGRFLQGDHFGEVMGMPFHGIGVTGFDNLAQRFTATWIDSMGTSILLLTGTYDSAAKTFTYTGEMEDMLKPGTRVKVRETLKVLGPDAHVMEWYETRGGQEAKTLEVAYARQK